MLINVIELIKVVWFVYMIGVIKAVLIVERFASVIARRFVRRRRWRGERKIKFDSQFDIRFL